MSKTPFPQVSAVFLVLFSFLIIYAPEPYSFLTAKANSDLLPEVHNVLLEGSKIEKNGFTFTANITTNQKVQFIEADLNVDSLLKVTAIENKAGEKFALPSAKEILIKSGAGQTINLFELFGFSSSNSEETTAGALLKQINGEETGTVSIKFQLKNAQNPVLLNNYTFDFTVEEKLEQTAPITEGSPAEDKAVEQPFVTAELNKPSANQEQVLLEDPGTLTARSRSGITTNSYESRSGSFIFESPQPTEEEIPKIQQFFIDDIPFTQDRNFLKAVFPPNIQLQKAKLMVSAKSYAKVLSIKNKHGIVIPFNFPVVALEEPNTLQTINFFQLFGIPNPGGGTSLFQLLNGTATGSITIELELASMADQTKKSQYTLMLELAEAAPASFSLNFDTLSFHAQVGKRTSGQAKKRDSLLNEAAYTVAAPSNFSVMVSSTDLVSTKDPSFTLTGNRVQLTVGSSTYSLNRNGQIIDWGNAKSFMKKMNFSLDLSSDASNGYPDNEKLFQIEENTEFQSTVTFSFTGL